MLKSKRKEQKAMEEIVELKRKIKGLNALLNNAYFDLYLAKGFTADQIEKIIR